jgi:glycosyltransferase involved in cell wall biosynthesis
MEVLVITGDKHFASSERLKLQTAQVERLEVMYWGRGSLFPRLPQGTFDVVTVQDPLLRGTFARHVAKKLHARVNMQVHMDLSALPWWKRMLAGVNLRRASSVRVVSDKIKKQVAGMGAVAPITVLPIFVDIARFKEVVRKPAAQKTILWVGRFEAEKDPAFAIQVLQEVRAAGVDAKLVLLGKGSLEQGLRALAKGLAVEFPGWQDTRPYLAASSVVLCTSRHESWGASIVEALAAGVPVVAPDVGIAREAGAIVAGRGELAQKIIEVVQTNTQGQLMLNLPSAEEWAQGWRESLM